MTTKTLSPVFLEIARRGRRTYVGSLKHLLGALLLGHAHVTLDAVPAITNPQAIISVFNPFGLATDQSGNVMVIWDAVGSQALGLFSPQGQLLRSSPVGGLGTTFGSRLATDLMDGVVIQLWEDGALNTVDPVTLRLGLFASLRDVVVPTDAVFDVAVGQTRNLSGLLALNTATYTDIAVLRRDHPGGGFTRDLFVTGYAVAFPFVMRVRLVGNGAGMQMSYRLMAASTVNPGADRATNFIKTARGIAVNPEGLVLTSLPVARQTPAGVVAFDVPVAFSADYPEGVGRTPFLPLGDRDLYSSGMATDPAGNFYVATGVVGTSDCGGSALVMLDARLNSPTCLVSGGNTLANLIDVALSPDGHALFLLIGGTQGGVIRFDLSPSGIAPTITTHPQSQTVTAGARVTFNVVATGTPPLSYQWRKDGQVLSGQTGSTLTLANVQSSHAGSYTVVVGNSAGQVTSDPATLTVNSAQVPRHPADVNPSDNQLTLQEVIAYAAAYKRGQVWPEGPNPIPLDYMIRAATLYKRGETYRHDPNAGGPPLWWVNLPPP